jgi:tetratricopeptide (TPR) repeat protein
MTVSLKQFALLALITGVSLPAYSYPDKSKANNTEQSSEGCIQSTTRVRVRRIDDSTKSHDGAYWFSRGYSLHQTGHYVEAIDAFSRSIGLRYRQATAIYNVACGFALLHDKDNAIFWLDRALRAGFDRPDLLNEDSDLDSLRTDPRFGELLKKTGSGQSDAKSPKHKEAKYADNRTDESVLRFEQLSRDSSADGDEWYRVGSRLIRLRDFDRATTALGQAINHLGYRGASAMYNLACAYALKGDSSSALDWLEKSVNAGFDEPDHLVEDEDLASLRGQPRFKRIHELSKTLSLSQFTRRSYDGSQYSRAQWAPAVRTYEAFLRSEPSNGRGWFNLGYALHYSREHIRAIDAFEHAIRLGYRVPTSQYNIACAHSMIGDRDAAFEWLEKSLDSGFDVENYIRGDRDLDNLRSDPRFERFLRLADVHTKDK